MNNLNKDCPFYNSCALFSGVKCGFPDSNFMSYDNFKCGLLTSLRIYGVPSQCNDENLLILDTPECEFDFLIMTWYKSRGGTTALYTSKGGFICHATYHDLIEVYNNYSSPRNL